MPTHLTLAIAGHAPNKPAHLDALLSDFLGLEAPDDEGYRPLPDRYSGLTGYFLAVGGVVPDGLLNALDVCLSIEGLPVQWHLVTDKATGQIEQLREYVDEVHVEKDPTEFLIGLLHGSPGSQLLINWDVDDSEDDALISAVHTAGDITVRDLAQGMHTLVPDKPEEGEGTAEAPDQTAEELPEEDQELEDAPPATPAPPASLEEDVAAAARQHTPARGTAAGDVTVDATWLGRLHTILDAAHRFAHGLDLHNAAKNLDKLRPCPLAAVLEEERDTVARLLHDDTSSKQEKPIPKSPEPEKSAAKNGGKKVRVMWDEAEGEWKKTGRGRVRDGVKTAWMDDAGNVTDTK